MFVLFPEIKPYKRHQLKVSTEHELYVDEAGFVAAVTAATNSAVAEGFLLQEDADAIITRAPQQWRSQTESP